MTTTKNYHRTTVQSIALALAVMLITTVFGAPDVNAQNQKRNWLSAIGNVLNTATSIAGGQNTTGSYGNNLSSNSTTGQLNQSFKYSGEQRKGQKDFNGRIIQNEITSPCAYGQTHYTFYEDGYCLAYTVTTCVGCYGKRTCYVCNGYGRVYNNLCGCCGGTGRCKNCQGAGYRATTKLWTPGEANAYLSAQRQTASSASQSASSSSKTSTCSKCAGKGYTPQAYTYAAGSRLAPHHNNAGSTCFVCGLKTDHYHYRCTECKSH